MDARDTMRRAQLRAACQVAPEVFAQVRPRLPAFRAPFVDPLQGPAPRAHAQPSGRGWLSDGARQHVAAIAEPVGQDRWGWQGWRGWDDGDAAPWRHPLWRHVGPDWGQADGRLGFAPAAFPQSGRESGGGARPWGGRLGQVAHGQGAIDAGDVSRQGPTLGDLR